MSKNLCGNIKESDIFDIIDSLKSVDDTIDELRDHLYDAENKIKELEKTLDEEAHRADTAEKMRDFLQKEIDEMIEHARFYPADIENN